MYRYIAHAILNFNLPNLEDGLEPLKLNAVIDCLDDNGQNNYTDTYSIWAGEHRDTLEIDTDIDPIWLERQDDRGRFQIYDAESQQWTDFRSPLPFDDRQTAIILAALRNAQKYPPNWAAHEIDTAPDDLEIDNLCQMINFGD